MRRGTEGRLCTSRREPEAGCSEAPHFPFPLQSLGFPCLPAASDLWLCETSVSSPCHSLFLQIKLESSAVFITELSLISKLKTWQNSIHRRPHTHTHKPHKHTLHTPPKQTPHTQTLHMRLSPSPQRSPSRPSHSAPRPSLSGSFHVQPDFLSVELTWSSSIYRMCHCQILCLVTGFLCGCLIFLYAFYNAYKTFPH